MAGALAGTKLRIPVAHVGAGLRTFSRRTPEDINRTAADHICDLLLAPSPTAMKNLAAEGLAPRAVFTGDIMYDAVLSYRPLAAQRSTIGQRLGLQTHGYALAAMHRADNGAEPGRLRNLIGALRDAADTILPVVLPVHPLAAQRVRSDLRDCKLLPRLLIIDPLGYLDTLRLIDHAAMVLTDSGELQQEAFFLGCPCVTLRDETEWVETVEAGGNMLVGTDSARMLVAMERWQRYRRREDGTFSQVASKLFGNGDAAERILHALLQLIERNA